MFVLHIFRERLDCPFKIEWNTSRKVHFKRPPTVDRRDKIVWQKCSQMTDTTAGGIYPAYFLYLVLPRRQGKKSGDLHVQYIVVVLHVTWRRYRNIALEISSWCLVNGINVRFMAKSSTLFLTATLLFTGAMLSFQAYTTRCLVIRSCQSYRPHFSSIRKKIIWQHCPHFKWSSSVSLRVDN